MTEISPRHTSVLLEEVAELMAPRSGGVYLDGTVGAGGHTLRLAELAPDARFIALDRDPAALELARARLAPMIDRVTLVHASYGELDAVLDRLGHDAIDGLLLDLGVSSMQLDDGARGFSFVRPGPIDMRMDPTVGPTALELIRSSDTDELATILRDYGEERHHRRIAERIKEAARAGRLATTVDLAEVVSAATPAAVRRQMRIHPATLTFQALRIAVNRELDELERFLARFPTRLRPGGRCAIISFHSLEDRLVKHGFRDLAWASSLPPDLARQAGERVDPIVRVVTRRAATASDAEMAANPRSRSARLRVCEKVAP